MVLNKFTGSTQMDGTEKPLYKIVGSTMKHFMAYTYLKALQAGESLRLRVYNKVDDVSHWKLDGDVTDSVGGNNGTITNISSWVSQWKFDGNVNDSIGSNNGTITYNTNLKKLYKFESNVNDTIGNGNGTITGSGSSYVTGQEGTAINLDSSTYVSFPSTNLPTGTTDRSVSFWVKTPSSFTASTYLFDWGANSNNNAFGVIYTSTGSTSTITAVGFANDKASSTVLQVNTWYHIVITLSSSGTIRNLYVNGVLDSNFPFTATALNTTSSSVYLNSIIGGGNESGGTYDEFRIYNTAISQAQVSALYMNGKFAQSHTFDGDGTHGEWVQTSIAPSSFSKTSPFTLSFWMKHGSITYNQFLIATRDGQAGTSVGLSIWIWSGDSGTSVNFSLADASGNIFVAAGGSGLNDNRWHHVACTFDGSANQNGMKLYLDGVLAITGASLAMANSITGLVNLRIGASANSDSLQYQGQLDEVRYYNIALNASQIAGLYNYTGSNYVTPLPVGSALSLDGSSYVTITNQTPYNFERTNSFSISAWINTSKLTTDLVIFSKQNTAYTDKGYSLRIGTNNHFIINIVNTFASNAIIKQTSNSYNDGNWHNVIVTYAGTSAASGVNFYVDGVLVSMTTTQDNLSATITNTNNACIGSINNNLNWVGLLDEVQVFNYVVSAAEINAINAGRFANTHPIGLWHFDGDLYDYSGQGSTGSPTGTMTYVTGALSGSYNVPNQHFNFDGSETINAGNASNLSFEYTQAFSFSFWAKYTSTATLGVIGKTAAGLGGNGYWLYFTGGNLDIQLVNINNTNDIVVATSSTYNDGLLHHFVVTYNGNGKASGISIYVDGSSVSTSTVRDNLANKLISNTQNVVIGGLTVSDNQLVAELDDVRIYNRALSSAEVSDLYTYPDSAMKSLVYDKTYTGVVSDTKYIVPLQGNQMMVTAQQLSGTNRLITWEREEVS